jgi:uncharacterized protein (DUF362 family)/Pyruvate/2-oxoacid:ferredoxin oxidoreductase delta subunit
MPDNKHPREPAVSIVRADDYDYGEVFSAVEKCLELIGGLNKIVKPGENVFVKINHLPPSSPPERGIITHPVFLKAVVENLKTARAHITVGDDIGKEPIGHRDPEGIDGFQISGIRQVCEESGVKLVNLREAGFVETDCRGFLLDKVYVSKVALEADKIINLPKLKTHSLTVYTGGIKNMYGTIPKGKRLQYHYNYRKHEDFHRMLVDVFSAIKPHLTIMDGIIAMEGDGPSLGDLRKLGIVLASQDTVALEAVALNIIGLDPKAFFMTKYAHEKGLGDNDIKRINVVGEAIDNVRVPNFRLPVTRTGVSRSKAPAFISRIIESQSVIKPRIIKSLCTGCLECKKTCPANAIIVINTKAKVNKSLCISCYCCHEACRYDAIILKRPLLRRLISRTAGFLRKLGINP